MGLTKRQRTIAETARWKLVKYFTNQGLVFFRPDPALTKITGDGFVQLRDKRGLIARFFIKNSTPHLVPDSVRRVAFVPRQQETVSKGQLVFNGDSWVIAK